jgi:glycine/D-amino acid oxidase-like deaminating enzyme
MEQRKVGVLPGDDAANGWLKMLAPRQPRPHLAGDRTADWLVIGAGYAGLAAARRLAETRPAERIILLEAQAIGEGAAGRNSGFAIDVPHNVGSSLEELEGSNRFLRLSRAATEHLDSLVQRHGIACDWSRIGKFHAAVSPAWTRKILEPFARELEALGESYRWYDHAALAREIGTTYYNAAVYTPGGALMNPAALMRGLADSLPENVLLCENSPVTAIDYSNGIRVETQAGSVQAPRLVLATNGFAPHFGFFKRRLISLAAYASLSRPLTDSERQALGGSDEWGLTPANAIAGVTMRLTRDRRILIRQHFNFAPDFRRSDADRTRVRALHQRIFRKRFPMLLDVTMEHSWAGFVCLSRNHAPGFGQAAHNVWTAVCQNAVGVTKGTISGLLAADMACGIANPLIEDMKSLGAPTPVPPRPILDLAVEGRLSWEIWQAREER